MATRLSSQFLLFLIIYLPSCYNSLFMIPLEGGKGLFMAHRVAKGGNPAGNFPLEVRLHPRIHPLERRFPLFFIAKLTVQLQ